MWIQRDIFDTARYYICVKGMTTEQTIQELQVILKIELPENIKNLIRSLKW